MPTFLAKVHVISTFIALICLFIATIFGFLYFIDQIFYWNLFPGYWERYISLIAILALMLAAGSGGMSLILSFYRKAETN